MKCIEDEIPFEVPDGWEWERLGNISTIARGGSPRPIKAFLTNDAKGVNWIKIGDTEKDGKYIFSTKERIKPEGVSKSRFVKSGDFLLTNSMSFGRPYILKTEGCIHDGWLVIGDIELIFDQDYLYYALSAKYMYQTMAIMAGGSTVDNLNSDLVKSLMFPIPPINEQKYIARKVSDLLELVESIKSNEETIVGEISLIKSKILDLAIRGELVPQDPNDEPASVLLDRIRAEKEELIKAGKIKRDKKESVIFKGEDNSYYENLPSNWALTSLGMISKVITKGTTPRGGNVSYTSSGIGFLRAENILGYDKLNLDNLKYVDDKTHTGFLKRSILESNDILITIAGTLGRTAIVTESALPLNTNQAVALVRLVTTKFVNIKYLIYAINSSKIKKDLLHQEVAMAIPNLSLENIYDCKIPLPPIEEQNRISEVIDKIFVVLDIIEQSLN
ncbi:restriction endonuclease subunit S [Criibacterium bergeronii]|uniref:Restriction endonuclease subunit S n=1 Tax=Criibacterium bergeronii TaxID=1871336 RepID=A0A371IL02_9FIRM|nr:restriction endonuclease subunit S [Criibacterium bergeronii]RDY21172.1 restriction endonuclease subunit S [Criibacterium bergeronii]